MGALIDSIREGKYSWELIADFNSNFIGDVLAIYYTVKTLEATMSRSVRY